MHASNGSIGNDLHGRGSELLLQDHAIHTEKYRGDLLETHGPNIKAIVR